MTDVATSTVEIPRKVILTSDYRDLAGDVYFKSGTVLERSPHGTGQYSPPPTKLGVRCVASFRLIKDICAVLEC